MTQHLWGDNSFDWDALNDACAFYSKYMFRYGLMLCLTKEKYGTMRLEWFDCLFGRCELGTLIFNTNHLIIKMPRLYRFDLKYFVPLMRNLRISNLLCVYQRFIFNIITVSAIKKWKHIKDEIMYEQYFEDLLYDWVKKRVNYVCNWKTYKIDQIKLKDNFREEL